RRRELAQFGELWIRSRQLVAISGDERHLTGRIRERDRAHAVPLHLHAPGGLGIEISRRAGDGEHGGGERRSRERAGAARRVLLRRAYGRRRPRLPREPFRGAVLAWSGTGAADAGVAGLILHEVEQPVLLVR